MAIVYIGLGSNMGDCLQIINTAIESLGLMKSTNLIKTSSLYISKPIGQIEQENYINAVSKLETSLTSLQLLNKLQALENDSGRVRNERWGPRTLDLDILMYNDEIIRTSCLTVPHPEMANRSFVLVPLAEIEPDCVIPKVGTVNSLIKKINLNNLVMIK